MNILRLRNQETGEWQEVPALIGPQGPQGEKGADGTMSFEDLTEEQKASLKGDPGPQGETGPQGEPGPAGESYVITDEDYSAIADVVLSKMTNADEVSY